MQEIYLLTKHANFSAEYIKKIPVHNRRYYLTLFREEMKEQEEAYDKARRGRS